MLYGLYLSAAGMQAQEYRQNVTANNLANSGTTGFKRDLAMVQSRLEATHEDGRMLQYRVPVLSDQGGGVLAMPTMMDMSQGTILPSGSATDMALKGPGFFTVAGDKDGEKMLTRDGHFMINGEGTLVTANGRNVLGADGNAIKFSNPSLSMDIDSTGAIKQSGVTVAQLGVVDVKDQDALKKMGGNLLAVDDAKEIVPADAGTQVKQGALENSGVDPIVEMTNMMQNQRAFEANAKMIGYQDTTLQLLSTVGRVA